MYFRRAAFLPSGTGEPVTICNTFNPTPPEPEAETSSEAKETIRKEAGARLLRGRQKKRGVHRKNGAPLLQKFHSWCYTKASDQSATTKSGILEYRIVPQGRNKGKKNIAGASKKPRNFIKNFFHKAKLQRVTYLALRERITIIRNYLNINYLHLEIRKIISSFAVPNNKNKALWKQK